MSGGDSGKDENQRIGRRRVQGMQKGGVLLKRGVIRLGLIT